ncbi:MAG: hypothetical protein F6K19_06220 [Cyanothece sp. SIO1E1]|nr:hypothetical protein [Cyanothece sp. SIO1E1]
MSNYPRKSKRYRGFVLTATGLQKLQAQMQRLESQTRLRQNPRTIAERVQLSDPDGIHPMTVRKVLRCQGGVDKSSIQRIFKALELELEESDCAHANLYARQVEAEPSTPAVQYQPRHDWGEAMDVADFYGRNDELTQLNQMVVADRCRLIALLGMGGVGKTALSIKFAQQMAGHRESLKDEAQSTDSGLQSLMPEFEYIVWRSLRHAPTLQELLTGILQFLSQPLEPGVELPTSVEALTARLIEKLQQHRCLLILDQYESVLSSGRFSGHPREDYESYGELLKLLSEVPHQSCLMLTSREQPRELKCRPGQNVQVLHLQGLKLADSRSVFQQWGHFTGAKNDWKAVVEHYRGNPLALKMVAARTQEYFNGSIFECLEELRQGQLIFGDLKELIGQQFDRLSELEKDILCQFAKYQEGVSLSRLRKGLTSPIWQQNLLEVLDSLRGRSLVEKQGHQFRLQPLMLEHISEYLAQKRHRLPVALTVNLPTNDHAVA